MDYQLFGLSIKDVAAPQYGPLSLYVKVEGPSIVRLDFYSYSTAFG